MKIVSKMTHNMLIGTLNPSRLNSTT